MTVPFEFGFVPELRRVKILKPKKEAMLPLVFRFEQDQKVILKEKQKVQLSKLALIDSKKLSITPQKRLLVKKSPGEKQRQKIIK